LEATPPEVATGGRFEVALSHNHFEELLRSHLVAPEIHGKDVAPQMVRGDAWCFFFPES